MPNIEWRHYMTHQAFGVLSILSHRSGVLSVRSGKDPLLLYLSGGRSARGDGGSSNMRKEMTVLRTGLPAVENLSGLEAPNATQLSLFRSTQPDSILVYHNQNTQFVLFVTSPPHPPRHPRRWASGCLGSIAGVRCLER